MMIINGVQQSSIDVNDRGLAYGDGLFETIEIASGKPVYWRRHLGRLQHGCDVLGLVCPEENLLLQECTDIAKGAKKGIVKIMLTRGSGGRGYRPVDNHTLNRILSFHAWPTIPGGYYENGIRLYLCEMPVSMNRKLAGIKTLCRLDQVMAQSEWDEADYAEGVMLDNNGLVIEGTKTNIFIVNQGKLFTPSLTDAGIHGIMRSIIIEAAGRLGIGLVEKGITSEDLVTADELFVCNSIIKIWPVCEYLDRKYEPGEITNLLTSELERQSSTYE